MKNFLVHDDNTRAEMLESIGLKSVTDLFKQIPEDARLPQIELENPIANWKSRKGLRHWQKITKLMLSAFLAEAFTTNLFQPVFHRLPAGLSF